MSTGRLSQARKILHPLVGVQKDIGKKSNALQVLEAEHSSNLLALLPDVLLDKVTTKNNLAAQHRHCGSLLSHSVHPLAFPDAEKHLKQALKMYR